MGSNQPPRFCGQDVKGDIELREEGKMTLLAGRESIVICLVMAAAHGLWSMRWVAEFDRKGKNGND